MSEATTVSVFDFDDYRAYLRAKFEQLKAEKPFWSHRYFARKAEISSPSFLQLVINNKRNLSRESVFKFSRALGHTKKEHEFFENLVFLNQSKSLKEKNYYYEKVARNTRFRSVKQLQKLEYDYFSNWFIPVVRELVELPGFRDDPEWIAKKLNPPITVTEARRALKVLLELGLVVADDAGRYQKREPSLTTEAEVRDLSIKNYHETMIQLAKEAIQRFPSDQRHISSLTLGITERQFQTIKKRLVEFGDEILALATGEDRGERIYQFNFQVFPLIQRDEPKPSEPCGGSPCSE
ncbi:MAG: hypothetical protein A2284_16840 [Deltaproteobacteria bacterium RIFOXYA12_FULL_61_11]|nr:MAG: hypothetical protein A2284_16840 [Deltaproteobacteria bacterium RIFOXYA12_FULL_61_11]